ncbi:MAG: hypothetical protein OQK72_13355 [Gammaproteobacteria bacterium]|nr:hypothetical protein [Gammaproteobacteria bacterium]MCW9006156.1 hypothetical protein [Gammaproteobacteria bacterium]MCW9055444.1 hypothetical protein [Gammaproteobacteria bacterium]
MQNNTQQQNLDHHELRDVSSTARLFSFNRPVYMTSDVWHDCVELMDHNGKTIDELAVLQRLRHVLFMASSALHGRVKNLECEFKIHRVPNDSKARHPEPTTLKLVAHEDQFNQPVITIKQTGE